VKRAIFTTAIKNREPTNNISELSTGQQKIHYFTDVRGMQGQKVKHRWIYKGKVMAEVEFKVNRKRCFQDLYPRFQF
jgi:ribosomal protein S7